MYEVTKLIRPNAGVKSLIAHMILTNAFADVATVSEGFIFTVAE